jgi:hypothetical protein
MDNRKLTFLLGECVQINMFIDQVFQYSKKARKLNKNNKGLWQYTFWWTPSPICKPYHDGIIVELWLVMTRFFLLTKLTNTNTQWTTQQTIRSMGYRRLLELEQNCGLGVRYLWTRLLPRVPRMTAAGFSRSASRQITFPGSPSTIRALVWTLQNFPIKGTCVNSLCKPRKRNRTYRISELTGFHKYEHHAI